MMKPEQPQERKQTDNRTQTYRKGRNFDNKSRENRHKCHYCKFKGHYEKDCPQMQQFIFQIKRAEENDSIGGGACSQAIICEQALEFKNCEKGNKQKKIILFR